MTFDRLGWLVRRMAGSLWFRPALAVLAAPLALALSPAIAPLLPPGAGALISVGDVEAILGILSSSMLAVAIFSLGTMVSALQAASSAATPRARPLLTGDSAAQTAISTFVGAFLFSVLGQVGLALDLYGPAGRAALFLLALILTGAVIVALVAWIERLAGMGGVVEAIELVERAAAAAFDRLAEAPCFGGVARPAPPAGAVPVFADMIGFVQHVDAGALQSLAERVGGYVHVDAPPGTWVHPARPLAHALGRFDDAALRDVRAAFSLGRERRFENDPRFGLIALSEIASRALSPAVNDPGTAIDVTAAQARALAGWAAAAAAAAGAPPAHPRLSAAPLDPVDLFEDAFRPTARDGAGCVEVMIRLRKALAALAAADPDRLGPAARRMAADAAERADAALASAADRAALGALPPPG